ncbi:MAG TPA: tetratricopeptide repeat protein [Longimicrobiales bacterium]|nr:tetratricopeptide repeat protein [Longimicrobiales bacterium]
MVRRAGAVAVAGVLALALAACGGSRGPSGPVVSPTGIVYEPGTPPSETRRSQTASLYLRQERVDRALELALEGIAEFPENPIHYYLAGVAHARLAQYEPADSMFDVAQRMYPAYELDIEPEREAAWGQAFNDGLEAYELGYVDETVRIWTGATRIYDLRPEAHRNLASLLASEALYDEAIEVYRDALAGLDRRPATRLLLPEDLEAREESRLGIEESLSELLLATSRFAEAEPLLRRRLERDPDDVELRAQLAAALAGMGRHDEARDLYASLLSAENLELTQIFSLGIGLFRSGQYTEAAEAFQRVTELQPESRDAWFNYANSLFAAGAWEDLTAAGARLIELDPLGENSRLMTARARLELGDREGALEYLDQVDRSPVYIEGLQMQRSEGSITIFGRVVGNAAQAGSPVGLRFTFFGDGGVALGTETVQVLAPTDGEEATFEVAFSQTALAYRYEAISE